MKMVERILAVLDNTMTVALVVMLVVLGVVSLASYLR